MKRFKVAISSVSAAIFCGAGVTASADSPTDLPYFIPGEYSLVQGELNLCSEGDFYIHDHGKYVALGVYHGFETKDDQSSLPGDAPGDEGCVYQGTNDVQTYDKKTVLTSTDTRVCKGRATYQTKEVATIHKNGVIHLSVVQLGEPAFKYMCTWVIRHLPKK